MSGRADDRPDRAEVVAELRRRKRVLLRAYDDVENELQAVLAARDAERLTPEARRRTFSVIPGGAS